MEHRPTSPAETADARVAGERGISLIEATVVLTVAAVLSAVVAPVASRTLDRARLSRAVEDTRAIRTAIDTFLLEFTGFTPFTTTGAAGGATVQMLVSDGDTPVTALASVWDDPVGGAVPVDFLERHLVTNTPMGGGSYTTAGVSPWRGAYISAPVDPDPWGNRYAVNVLYLRTAPTSNDVFVLSAGPDEAIATPFAVNGVAPGEDDIIAVVRRDPGRNVP